MDELSGTAALGRALLHLERVSATGVLRVTTRHESCRLLLLQGRVWATEGVSAQGGDSLGDILHRGGDLDQEAHGRALAASVASGPVGGWLVAHEVATAPAVALGLRRQLRTRLLQLLSRDRVDYNFEGQPAQDGDQDLLSAFAPRAAEVVLSALRIATSDLGADDVPPGFPGGRLELTRAGEQLMQEGSLWPEEHVLRALLRSGTSLDECRSRLAQAPRALRLLYGLSGLQVLQSSVAAGEGYSRLLRKRRQIRLGADPYALLELPLGSSPQHARKALRRLALEMHPDRVGAENASLQAISSEVMRGLLLAEERIRHRVA